MKKISYNKFYVIDLELTCWDNLSREEQLSASEIIEIGISEVCMKDKKILKKKSYFVKPNKNPVLSDFCKNLTKITQEEIDKAPYLPKVSKNIRKDFPQISSCVWGAWGDDNLAISKEFTLKNAVNPFNLDKYYDIQELFVLKNSLDKRISMIKALEMKEIPHVGVLHRADDDSYNTALLLLDLLS